MIFGVFKCSPNGSNSFFHYNQECIQNEAISVHPVNVSGFSGGYCLNKRLPYRQDDLIYCSDDGMVVILSGCIYNRHEFDSQNKDTNNISHPEKIAGLFRSEGPEFAARLNGDFAICIIIQQKKLIWLFRDHIGIEPLVWSLKGDSLYFSSDLFGLCNYLYSDEPVNTEFLAQHFKYIDLRATPSSMVKKLHPGHWLKYDGHDLEIKEYWEPSKVRPAKGLAFDTMITRFGELLEDSVKIRCDNRFTAGVHVSGGLDSGVVAALARKSYSGQEKFYGFSLSPAVFDTDHAKDDERESVRKVCEMADIVPVFSEMSLNDFKKYISEYSVNYGYFSDDAILGKASALNVNMVFSGWGGDEFISTRSRSIEADLFWGLHFRQFFRRHPVTRPRHLLRVLINAVLLPTMGIVDRNLAHSLRQDARYLKRKFKPSDRKALQSFFMHSSRRNHHLGMLSHYHLQERCEAWSTNGWRSGVEYRYPLLDRRIIEFMISVPSVLLCRETFSRPLLRSLAKGLIPEGVRLNKSKIDPVYSEFIGKMFIDTGKELIDEIVDWKSNTDLSFIDFKQLEKDIALDREDLGEIDELQLFRTVVYIKALNDYTLRYHQKQ